MTLTGDGFTGVLASVSENSVSLITSIGEAPSCPLGSSCNRMYNNYGNNCNNNCNNNCLNNCTDYLNSIGSVTEIPLCRIVSFTHNAI